MAFYCAKPNCIMCAELYLQWDNENMYICSYWRPIPIYWRITIDHNTTNLIMRQLYITASHCQLNLEYTQTHTHIQLHQNAPGVVRCTQFHTGYTHTTPLTTGRSPITTNPISQYDIHVHIITMYTTLEIYHISYIIYEGYLQHDAINICLLLFSN